ncbi:MAG TPA: hypothetical protein VEL74_11580, partial [Thermoanaerobaculia bacterium]|nr:hypothetical protein [Thermoanaerobaculia bacterium]
MLALLPVGWLFSLSSRFLMSAVLFHVCLWAIGLLLAWRFLGPALRASGAATGALLLWLGLFFLVSLQSTTLLRPVLARDTGAPLFVEGKKSFFEHLGDAGRWDEKKERERAEALKKEKAKQEALKKEREKKQQEAHAKKKGTAKKVEAK